MMTEEEIQELDAFLLSEACDEETLAVDEAHGYLTALQLLPEPPATAACLSAIWGEPAFADAAQQQRMTALLVKLGEEIAAGMQRREQFEPLLAELEDEGEVVESYEGWCYGFMLAVELHPEPWLSLPGAAQGLLAPMARLALLDDEEEEPMDEDEYLQWVELLPGAVSGLYALWHKDQNGDD